jgi:molecular chaperone Hsp33
MADRIDRWMTGEGTVRILTASSTRMVAEAARVAASTPVVTEALGCLLTGVALLELGQSPVDRVQCAFVHDGSAGQMLADVWPGPEVRGRVEAPRATQEPVIGARGELRMSRHGFRSGSVYQSQVAVEGTSLADALQAFCMESEQTATIFSLAVAVGGQGEVERAGGLMVQALPDCEREHLERVTACLEQASFVDLVHAGEEPADAARTLLDGIELHILGEDPLIYRCRCSLVRAADAVRTLSPEELAEVRDGRVEEVTCDFCSMIYKVGAAELDEQSS